MSKCSTTLAVAMLFLASCGADDSPSTSATDSSLASDASADPGEVSFAEVYPIFAKACATAGCHDAAKAGELGMGTEADAYGALVGQAAGGPSCGGKGWVRVVAGDPETSLLMGKLSPTPPCGLRMPVTVGLAESDVERVRSWIAAGAER